MMKILIAEMMWEVGIRELERAGVEIDYEKALGRDRARLLAMIDGYDALVVRNETCVDAELLHRGSNLKAIGRLGVGLDNIDRKTAKERGIPVVAAVNANATSVSEYVIAAMLDAYRPLADASKDVHAGNWDRKRFTGFELYGKTLGLIGLGEIAHRVAKRGIAFGMRVIGFDPFVRPYDHILSETGVTQVTNITALLQQSDFVSIHVPFTKETKNMVNEETLLSMKETAYLINTSRGGIVNEEALCNAVLQGRLAGAYLDVLAQEPIQKNSRLLTVDGIHLTPHIAGLTDESQQRTSVMVAREVINVLQGKESLCLV